MTASTNRLDNLLDGFDQNHMNYTKNEQQKYNEREEFIKIFVEKRDALLKPILEGISEKIINRGHFSRVSTVEHVVEKESTSTRAEIKLQIRPKGYDELHGIDKSRTPEIKFSPDIKKKEIIIFVDTIDNSGSSGSISIYDIDEKFIHGKVNDWVEKVFTESAIKKDQENKYY